MTYWCGIQKHQEAQGFLESTRVLKCTKRKVLESTNRQKFEFYWLNNCSKNVYRIRGLFKGSLKLDKQENIF